MDKRTRSLKELGAYVQRARLAKDWKPEQLAVYAEVSRETVRLLEAGHLDVRVGTLVKILDALGCNLTAVQRSMRPGIRRTGSNNRP